MGTREHVEVTGKGTLVVETKVGKRYIKEIILVPGLKENLLSVGQMIEHGYYLVFGNHKVEIYNDSSLSNLVAKVQMRGNRSFPVKLQAEMHLAYKASVDHSTELWHRRFGHLNMSSLKLLKEQDLVVGLPEIKRIKEVCEGCVLGKQCREAFPREATTRALTPLELIHSDICGPMQTVTKAGNRFFLTFIDDCTRMCWVYFLRHKSEALTVFKKFKATVELQSGYKLKRLRSDRGGEYTSVEFDSFCEDKIPFVFWAEAVNISVYILNRCPTKAFSKKTPFEAYSGRKPGVKHLKVFGSLCYAHVPKQQRHKLDLASKRCIFLGYGSCEKGYRLYNIETGKVIVSRDVIFSENVCWDWNAKKETGVNIQLTGIREEEQGEEGSSCEFEEQLEVNEVPSLNTENSYQERVTGLQDFDHTPLKYKSIVEIYEKCNMCIIEPKSFEEVAKDDSWKKAMEDEITMIEKNNTWELVDRPFDKPIIGVKWVHKTKLNLDGAVQKNKAWLVAKGYSQKPGIDFNEIFAPVARLDTKEYAKTLLDKFGLKDCKSVATRLAVNEKLFKVDGSDLADETLYRQMVGSLLYLTATRPDIMFAASLLARFMHNPTKKHMGTAKRVLRYTQGVFSWASIKQSSVALSIAKAEYMSAAEATTQAVWLRFVLSNFGEEQVEPTQLLCDNTSAIAISKNLVHHHKTRHINRRFHFIRDALQNGEIDLLYCKTEEQVADIFTKPLARD
ncbi:unnamed protein product [Prunus brigantina]